MPVPKAVVDPTSTLTLSPTTTGAVSSTALVVTVILFVTSFVPSEYVNVKTSVSVFGVHV